MLATPLTHCLKVTFVIPLMRMCCDAGRKIARNVAAMATSTGEVATADATAETATTELPSELVQKIQEVVRT